MSTRRPVGETALAAWLWQLLDARVGEDGDAVEPPVLSGDQQAVAAELSAVFDAVCALWQRRDDEALAPADIDRVRSRCSEAGGSSDGVGAICAFLDTVCMLVGDIRAIPAAAEEDDAEAAWFHWVRDVPVRVVAPDLVLLEQKSDACWSLYASARVLGLERWREELAGTFLRLSRDVFVAAGQLRRWDVAAAHRGRHHAVRAARRRAVAGESIHEEHFMLHDPSPILDGIGCELARAHDRQQELLGSAIGISPAAIAFDVVIHCRPPSPDAVDDFFGGYLHCASERLAALVDAIDAASLIEQRRPADHLEVGRPAVHEHADLDLALCTWSLRREPGVSRLLERRLQEIASALGSGDPTGAEAAAALACEAADVAPRLCAEARAAFVGAVAGAFSLGRLEDVIDAVEAGLPYLDGLLDESEAGLVEGLHLLSLSRLSPVDEVELVVDGCAALVESGDPGYLDYCATVLWSALAHEVFVADRSKLVGLLVTCQVRRARHEQSSRPIVELTQQLDELAAVDALPDPALLDAALAGAAAVAGPRVAADEIVEAGAAVAAHLELAELEELIAQVAPNSKPEAAAAEAWLGAGIGEATYEALLAENWRAAVAGARADLDALGEAAKPDLRRVLLLGILARALRGVADTTLDPTVVAAAAGDARRLLDTAAASLLECADSALDREAERVWVLCAGDVGLAAVALHRRVEGESFPDHALPLLERAAEIAGRHGDPLELAGCLHDLAHAYHGRARELAGGSALESLERTAALFREVVALYGELRRQPGGRVALRDRPAHVDYLNLGRVHLEIVALLDLEPDLVEGTQHMGALSLRTALWTLSLGRDLALESGSVLDAARARLQLAHVKGRLALACLDHTRVNKGAFRPDFQLYLSVIEQVPASTWDFASRYAQSALSDVDEALTAFAASHDAAGLSSALQSAFLLLGIAQLRHGVSGVPIIGDDNLWNMRRMRRTTLVVLLASFERLLDDAALDGAVRSELDDWCEFMSAQMRLEDFRPRGTDFADLEAAAAAFERLQEQADPIVRAFVRPFADWFSVARTSELATVNGLALAPTADGVEVTLAAQGRSFVVEGLRPTETLVLLQESSWVKTNSTGAVASRLPQFDWSGAPPVVPVLAGACGTGPSAPKFLVARLPASGWDVWVVHLYTPGGIGLELSLPFRLRGIFRLGQTAERVRDNGPLGEGEVAVLDAAGLTLEVSMVRAHEDDEPAARLFAADAATRMQVHGEVRVALRTTPATVDSGVALVVRADGHFAGACAAATSPVVSPALGIPSSLMRSYSPLFLFDDVVDRRLLRRLRDSSNRTTIVVGAPRADGALDELLAATVDPRREVVFLVTSREVPRVTAALDRLTTEIDGLFASAIYSVGGSTDLPRADSPRVQVIEVERAFAPAAAQLALDLIAFRTSPVEDIPTGSGVVPFEFQLLGDPTAMREALARLPNPAGWDELVDRVHQVSSELPFERIGSATGFDAAGLDLLTRPAAKRPVLVVADDPALLLACTPFARHLGALVLPDDPRSWELVRVLEPPRVLAAGETGGARPGAVERLPADARELAVRFAAAAREDHEAGIDAVLEAGTAGAVDELLLQRMEPSAYAVVASGADSERRAAALAANYAAALGSPLLLFDDERVFSADAQTEAGRVLSGAIRGDLPRDVQRVGVDRFRLDHVRLPELEGVLDAIGPTYVGFVSNRMTIPIELAGDPPLATRYAVGRLTAPDVASLSLLITAAALREEVVRDPRPAAVVVEAADAVPDLDLPGARAEAEHVRAMLAGEARIAVTPIAGPDDRERFLASAGDAAILHFCGHGSYAHGTVADTGLVFRQGLLRPDDVPSFGRAAPIVFANACETGAAGEAEGLGRAWSGLAAAFIEAGALNYLGSLWPIVDSGSRELAERFYALLVEGHSVGEALRQAKLQSFSQGDATWAAVVLFGCPRNRLRSGAAGAA